MNDARISRADIERQPTIPDPREERWVLLVCSFKELHDPETGLRRERGRPGHLGGALDG